jgi:NAD-dependent DNA ligase
LLYGNQLQKALIDAGFEDTRPKPHKPRHKKFTCTKCGSPMVIIEGTNTMACINEKCNQFFVFNT